ncbi:alpha/beta hydrolase, partial [Acidisphaera rubrifaciens]|uniref:alpha/beta hydrolase n=1 Tax=Acidisphaera rubrifaciens TaxID=50715 RepID=UPI0006627C1D
PAYAAAWEPRLAAVAAGGMEAVLSGTLDRWLSPATQAARPALRARLGDAILRTDPAGYAGCARAIQGLALTDDLARIACPTLLVAGGADAGIPLDAMRAIAAAIPGARLAVVADAAHIVNLDRTDAFDRAVDGFLDPAA